MKTKMVWPFIKGWLSKDDPTGHSKKREGGVYRRRNGVAILKSGQEWNSPAQPGQLKTGQGGNGLLISHLWCPDDL